MLNEMYRLRQLHADGTRKAGSGGALEKTIGRQTKGPACSARTPKG